MASAGVLRHLWCCGRGLWLHLPGVAADPAECGPDWPHDGVRRVLHLPPVRIRDLPHCHQGPGVFKCPHSSQIVLKVHLFWHWSGCRADRDSWGDCNLHLAPGCVSGEWNICIIMTNPLLLLLLNIITPFLTTSHFSTKVLWMCPLVRWLLKPNRITKSDLVTPLVCQHSIFTQCQARYSSVLPLLILGLCSIVGAAATFFLPETAGRWVLTNQRPVFWPLTNHRTLPQTLADGSQFGRDQSR